MKIKIALKICAAFFLLLVFCTTIMSCNSEKQVETRQTALLRKFSGEDIYKELMTRTRSNIKSLKEDTIPEKIRIDMQVYANSELYEALLVIYGKDDRKNFYDTVVQKNKLIVNDAEKVACIVYKNQLSRNADGTYTLKPNGVYGNMPDEKLCSSEKFYGEPVAAFCTGFAVGKYLFATAGHCIDETPLNELAFIYGYRMKDAATSNLVIKPEDIFFPVQVIKKELSEQTKNDFCIVKVNKEIPASKIATVRTSGKIADGEQIYVIGHPCGLPLKITLNAKIYNNTIDNYFVANLDTYGGNSGSPVFNSKTHVVEGILVRGNDDFEYIPVDECKRSFICPENIGPCRGEDVSRVSQFLPWIK